MSYGVRSIESIEYSLEQSTTKDHASRKCSTTSAQTWQIRSGGCGLTGDRSQRYE